MAAASRFAGCADVADMLERLPFELGEAVFEHAGLATKLLHGRLPLPLDDRTSALVWIDCMANDLVGCVPLLPLRSLTFEPYLAPPSRAMVAAIRKKPGTELAILSQSESVIRAALLSLETCRLLLQKARRQRLATPSSSSKKSAVEHDRAIMVAAAGVGDTAALRSAIASQGRSLNVKLDDIVKATLRYDQKASFEVLLPHIVRPARFISNAVAANAIKCFKMLTQQFGVDEIDGESVFCAVEHGYDDICTWLVENSSLISPKQRECFVFACIKYRRIDLLRAFNDSGVRLKLHHAEAARAASRGDMELFGVLRPHLVGDNWFKLAMRIAAGKGDLDAVRRLHSDFDLACDQGAMDAAAAGGHMDVIEFLRTHRTEGFSGAAMIGAAQGGHLGVVRFLHEQQIVCDDTVAMDCAARNGHIDILEFLSTERGARCSSKAIGSAAHNGHTGTVDWLLEHFPDESIRGIPAAVDNSIESKHRQLAARLIRNYPETVDGAAACKLFNFRWLDLAKIVVDSGHLSPSSELLRMTVMSGDVGIAKALIDSYNLALSPEMLRLAILSDNAEMLELVIGYCVRPEGDLFRVWQYTKHSNASKPIVKLLFERFPDLPWSVVAESKFGYPRWLQKLAQSLLHSKAAANQAQQG
ncbi:hypothetical protein HK105_201355 [Polyrhizophydium stewartii]|uniref:Ankyrin repeat protein n=1 Tax=Polyrhizophydium stewartii TaxID=2732419 RepID=A0ABR4NHS7_9FUNG